MSADRLRQAAKVLRERASAEYVQPGPWRQDGEVGADYEDLVVSDNPDDNGIVADCDTSTEHAAYIATMHPGVGLALAEWLTYEAAGLEDEGITLGDAYPCVALADLILGGESA